MIDCPICSRQVKQAFINSHIDSNCRNHVLADEDGQDNSATKPLSVSSFFSSQAQSPSAAPTAKSKQSKAIVLSTPQIKTGNNLSQPLIASTNGVKRTQPFDELEIPSTTHLEASDSTHRQPTIASTRSMEGHLNGNSRIEADLPVVSGAKRPRLSGLQKAQPLAERLRPQDLDEVQGQELVGPNGILRSLIKADRVPSMLLWGGPGTGKTTVARLVARKSGARFVEINSTSTGVAECKKLFAEARGDLNLTGRKTIIFCDEIHRFTKTQQDVFLAPVEAGIITLVGATTENPSFKVQAALLSRCRVFTLAKLTTDDIVQILRRAVQLESETTPFDPALISENFLCYLAAFSDGDARTSLNLLELAMNLSTQANATQASIKASLTKTLVYDRAGDQHYDTISAFHKSIRGSDPDAALYYLARMIQSGEDALYIARRMVVIASEDIGLADNSMLSLATATYTAAEKIGLPEARLNLAHCAVALALANKSVRAYRGYGNAVRKLSEPGVAALPIPIHLRNAPTRLMKEFGYGKEYKYNPDYRDGIVRQEYLPPELANTCFLENADLGDKLDDDTIH